MSLLRIGVLTKGGLPREWLTFLQLLPLAKCIMSDLEEELLNSDVRLGGDLEVRDAVFIGESDSVCSEKGHGNFIALPSDEDDVVPVLSKPRVLELSKHLLYLKEGSPVT